MIFYLDILISTSMLNIGCTNLCECFMSNIDVTNFTVTVQGCYFDPFLTGKHAWCSSFNKSCCTLTLVIIVHSYKLMRISCAVTFIMVWPFCLSSKNIHLTQCNQTEAGMKTKPSLVSLLMGIRMSLSLLYAGYMMMATA